MWLFLIICIVNAFGQLWLLGYVLFVNAFDKVSNGIFVWGFMHMGHYVSKKIWIGVCVFVWFCGVFVVYFVALFE